MRRWLLVLLLPVIAFGAPDAQATCNPGQSPFTDVADNESFCGSALWLRNAGITTGCPPGTAYCPFQDVTRAQMALFMKRLVRAATPDIVYSDTPSAGDVDGNGLATCITSTYTVPAGANARILTHATGTASILTDGPADLYVMIQMSVNGGLFATFGANPPRALVPGNQWTVVPVIGGQTMTGGSGAILTPGSTYQWRLLLQRQVAGTTGEVTTNRCQLLVHLPVDATF